MNWRSPRSGRALTPDGPNALSDGESERWPVLDGIPYLRTGREEVVGKALTALDRGDRETALVLLLGDADDWWTGPQPGDQALRTLVTRRETLSLREAMALLEWGPVADYFAYRWSDPTYLAGLALLEAHWTAPATAFELACGIGHYARELTRCGVACLAADVVFAKVWLAKHWVALEAEYVVFDAGSPWPLDEAARFDLVHCQDAFYFLPEQATVADRLRGATRADGVLAIGHLHNEAYAGGPMGPARSMADWRALFRETRVYDERALFEALLRGSIPPVSGWQDDPGVEAWSIVEGGGDARTIDGPLAKPPSGASLRRNPLLGPGGVDWPSARYEEEYAAGCYWALDDPPIAASPERDRRLVDLPERW